MNGLLPLFAFACCVITAAAVCTSTKYKQGPKDWLQCSESTIGEVTNNLQSNLIKIWVSQSVIAEIPNFAFTRNSTGVEILNLDDCGINLIGDSAFRGLNSVKELSLSHNSLTGLKVTWFNDLPSLEKLDLSFNKISNMDKYAHFSLPKLQRFDLNDNLLKCIPTENLHDMRQLKHIRIQENPLTHLCRAQLTLWLRSHKVSYATKEDNFMWLDDIIWGCHIDLENNDPENSAANLKMNTCVFTNMFNQLTTVLTGSQSMISSTTECYGERQALASCFWDQGAKKNGETILNLLALTGKEANVGQSH